MVDSSIERGMRGIELLIASEAPSREILVAIDVIESMDGAEEVWIGLQAYRVRRALS